MRRLDLTEIIALLPDWTPAEIEAAVAELVTEGFLRADQGRYRIA